MNKPKKVALAYSGGLDTSVILKWLMETYNCPVVAFAADLGQGEELDEVRAKANRRQTRSDWMGIERERGISVVTSVMTFEFEGLVFNLLSGGAMSVAQGMILGTTVVLVYTLVYTPLKPRTPLCTLAGAVCGAIPPMMGWTAAGAPLTFGAWLLAGVLFLWQIPHFLAQFRCDIRGGRRGGAQLRLDRR